MSEISTSRLEYFFSRSFSRRVADRNIGHTRGSGSSLKGSIGNQPNLSYSLWHGAANIALIVSTDVAFFSQPLPDFRWIGANNQVCLACIPIWQRATKDGALSKFRTPYLTHILAIIKQYRHAYIVVSGGTVLGQFRWVLVSIVSVPERSVVVPWR